MDGFNLYHSLVEANRSSGGKTTKWLDLKRLCSSYLPLAGQVAGEKADLAHIYYFSASPVHRSPDKINRHTMYIRCLRATGVNVELGRFKRKTVYCHNCNKEILTHEEKETDVAIAAKLFEICLLKEADSVILMTGDTDLAPAVRACRRLYPAINIFFAFPYKRHNAELAGIAPESIKIKLKSCLRNQFPDPLILPDGTRLKKPHSW